MSDIATLLAKEGLTLSRPEANEPPSINDTAFAIRNEASENSGASESEASETEASENEASENEDQVTMPPKSILKTSTPKKRVSLGIENELSNMAISSPIIRQTVKGYFPAPMLSGRWEEFNHKTDTMEGFTLMRMLIHNGSKDVDFELTWEDNRTFRVRVKWPKFMVSCLMMTSMDVREEADNLGQVFEVENFPPGHKVYDSMGANAKLMKEENGEDIVSDGVFIFESDMDVDKYETQLFQVPVNADEEGTILQIVFNHVNESTKKAGTPMKRKKRVIQYRTSPSSKSSNSPTTRRGPTGAYSPRRRPQKNLSKDGNSDSLKKKAKTHPGYIAYIEPPLLPETLPALHAFPPLPADPPSLTAAKTTPPRIPVNAGASQAIEADQFWGPNGEAFYDPDL